MRIGLKQLRNGSEERILHGNASQTQRRSPQEAHLTIDVVQVVEEGHRHGVEEHVHRRVGQHEGEVPRGCFRPTSKGQSMEKTS